LTVRYLLLSSSEDKKQMISVVVHTVKATVFIINYLHRIGDAVQHETVVTRLITWYVLQVWALWCVYREVV